MAVGFCVSNIYLFFSIFLFVRASDARSHWRKNQVRLWKSSFHPVKLFSWWWVKSLELLGFALTQFLAWWSSYQQLLSLAYLLWFARWIRGKQKENKATNSKNESWCAVTVELGPRRRILLPRLKSNIGNDQLSVDLGCFYVYFLFGYLLYGALFSALIGGRPRSRQSTIHDAGDYFPYIFSICDLLKRDGQFPDGLTCLLTSIYSVHLPPSLWWFRIPFGVQVWEKTGLIHGIIDSELLLEQFGFAAKIYRVGNF